MSRTSDVNFIPKPPNVTSNLMHAMGIDDSTVFKRFKKSLRNVGKELLDMSKQWGDQDPEAQMTFVQHALNEEPFLRQYQDAWPAVVYMRQFLSAILHQKTYRRRKTAHAKRAPASRATRPSTPPSRPQSRSRRQELAEVGAEIAVSVDVPPIATTTLDPSLRRFLRSFEPPLDHLAPSLQKCGVCTSKELTDMQKWSEGELRSFLRDDGKMNPFQTTQLVIALSGL